MFNPASRFPLTVLEDGSLLEAAVVDDIVYLVIDQRGERSGLARIELWECREMPELEIGGLLAVCQARSVVGTTEPSARGQAAR
jgi:hypothetical protein